MLLESCPRISRTDTCPAGRSVTGRGMPDICFGSGIWNCANAGAVKGKMKNEKEERQASSKREQLACRRTCRTSRRRRSQSRRMGRCPCSQLPSALCPLPSDSVSVSVSERTRLPALTSRAASSRSISSRYPLLVLSSCCSSRTARERRRADHLFVVPFGDLAHRAIELQLLDRAEHHVLLALDSGPRVAADHLRLTRLARRERTQRMERRKADQRRRKDSQADEDQIFGARAANDEDGCRRADERAEREELPRPQVNRTSVALEARD